MNFDSVRYEIYMGTYPATSTQWVDVSAWVINTSRCEIGIGGSGPLDRVASTGSLDFTLLNTSNRFTPGSSLRQYELTTGCKVRLTFWYKGRSAVKFFGYIPPNGLKLDTSPFFGTIQVQAVDFMEQLASHELELPAFAQNKKIGEIVALILANMPVKPLSAAYGTGNDTFATVFDTVKSTTRALQEINKVTLSEMGYAYVKPTVSADEVLVIEGRGARNGAALATVYTWNGDTDYLLLEDGGYLLLEDGGKIELHGIFVAGDALFSNDMRTLKISHADNYYNEIKTSVAPRRLGTAGEVLFNSEKAITISAGATVTVEGRFADPNQEAQAVSGINMVTPAATTDYLFNAAEDGTGTNMTADLSVTAVYGTNGVTYTLKNNHATTTGYVTKLQARGTGVYTYRPVDHTESNSTLTAAEGKRTLNYPMEYQDDPLVGADFSTYLLAQYQNKLTTFESATFVANRSEFLINAFLDLSVGDKLQIKDTSIGINRAFFITSFEFTVQPGGFVVWQIGLKDSVYDVFASWILGTSKLNTTTILGF